MIEKVTQLSQLKRILRDFPKNMKFCFAYGSGIFKQTTESSNNNMLDMVFVVSSPNEWHAENLIRNPSHYAQPLRFFGQQAITRVQESSGAKVYYNTLVKTSEGRTIKYGVISEGSLIEDLLDWNFLYISGRLHKPVEILIEPEENSELRTALKQNLHSAVHAALLLLPEHFSIIQFYKTITGLSYSGDFRMIFGEDKNKINNIVKSQLKLFRELYAPVLKHFDKYVDIPNIDDDIVAADSVQCRQDTGFSTKIHHLNRLPRTPQVKLVRTWSRGSRSKDTEDCLRALAHDPECCEILEQCFREIIWKSSVSQSLKGILTAGIYKSVVYSGRKIRKMIMSYREQKDLLPAVANTSNKIDRVVDSTVKREVEKKDISRKLEEWTNELQELDIKWADELPKLDTRRRHIQIFDISSKFRYSDFITISHYQLPSLE